MPLHIVRNDITKMSVDAIVNAANHTLLGGGGVDGAIHKAAGRKLLEECRKIGGCPTGDVRITKGYNLPAKFVIHAVGPIWNGGNSGEPAALYACYEKSLKLAVEHGCASIAFPLISAGSYGYPKAEALHIAESAIRNFLEDNEMDVSIVVYDRDMFSLSQSLFEDIQSFIDDRYVAERPEYLSNERRSLLSGFSKSARRETVEEPVSPDAECEMSFYAEEEEDSFSGGALCAASFSLADRVRQLDESFSEMLLRKIDEKGLTDAQCYKKANIDRKLFSKIRSSKTYHPNKMTVLAFAIALELPRAEVDEMLMKAGFALSPSSKADVIIEYFIERGQYDIFVINEALFQFDQCTLGSA